MPPAVWSLVSSLHKFSIRVSQNKSQLKKKMEKNMTSTKGSKGKVAPKQSRSKRSGLLFPVGRVERKLKEGPYAPRIASTAPVFLSSVLEYLATEVLELAGQNAKMSKQVRIKPKNIRMATTADEELATLFKDVVISGGGVTSHLFPEEGSGSGSQGL